MGVRALLVWMASLVALLAGLLVVVVLVTPDRPAIAAFVVLAVLALAGREAFARYCPPLSD